MFAPEVVHWDPLAEAESVVIPWNAKLRLVCAVLAGAMTLAACGGGDDAPAPVPIPEVVVIMKDIRRQDGSLSAALTALANARIALLEIRCGELTPAPQTTPPGNQYVLLVDVTAADAIRAKAFGFQIFGPSEQSRRLVALCL